MNMLFVMDSLSCVAGANVNIVRTLNRRFKEKNCKIYVLSKHDCRRPASGDLMREFDEAFLLSADEMEIIPDLHERLGATNKSAREAIWFMNHPGILLKGIDGKFGNGSITIRAYKKEIEKLCRERRIDAVIGVSAPYNIARAVSLSDINAVKALYQMDPYTNNYTMSERMKEKRRQTERRTIERLDVIFMPDFIREDIIKEKVYRDSTKYVEANLPGIINGDMSVEKHTAEKKKDSNEICFVFAGKMYEDIRNPEPLLQLFERLPDHYKLHILGAGCEKVVNKYKEALGTRLVYHGLVSKAEADRYTNSADILVNIDNTIRNQMPSKILDYINSRKQIINICSDCDCLAAKMLLQYSNGLNVPINEQSLTENAEMVKNFVSRGPKELSSDEILATYYKYTDKYVADVIYNTLVRMKSDDGENEERGNPDG